MKTPPRLRNNNTPAMLGIAAVIFVVSAWTLNLYLLVDLDPTIRGTFGDMFGTVNSAFSGLAFSGVIYAILLQRQEIEVTREEMGRTKEILDEQKKQLKIQNEETKRQIFESTFFQLIRLFTDLTNQMEIRYHKIPNLRNMDKIEILRGKEVFPYLLRELEGYLSKNSSSEAVNSIFHQESYELFYKKWSDHLGHYFRTIYNIVKFIDGAEIDISRKKFYSNILRAQLSDAEAAILFHNGISKFGHEKFKPLLEAYSLLKNVSDADVFIPRLKEKYEKSAFI